MKYRDTPRRLAAKNKPALRIVPKWVLALLTLALILPGALSGCGGTVQTLAPPATPTPAPPATAVPTLTPDLAYWPTDSWRTSTPEEQGVNSAQLLRALSHVSDAGINVRSMTVIRNGYVVLEAYNQPFTADRQYEVFSVTKSVTGALIGIAIHEGYIKDVREQVLSFFPGRKFANFDSNKQALTIEDLLTMQPGLDCWDDKLNGGVERSKDWVQFALDLPMASPPGEQLVYCTAGPHILSAILTKATGMSTAAYAQSRLFDPLGIAPGDITWGTDPQGITLGGYGISMKPADMAKLGLLYLYGGKWEGKQVVPAEWVTASSAVHAYGTDHKNYGYLFWVYPTHFAAEGLGEQVIAVVKESNMVVVLTSSVDWHAGPVVLKLLQDYILPAAKSDKPLPENASALADLQRKVAYMANPVEPVKPLLEAARLASGRTYLFGDNPAGWKSLTLTFKENNAEALATLEAVNGTTTVSQTVAIGLDNVYRLEKLQNGSFAARRGHWADDHTLVIRHLQSPPDLEETEIRADFSGDSIKVHVEEMVFGTYSYDFEGIATESMPQEPTITLPEEGARVMLPVHILARLGQPGEQVTAELRWLDGTRLTNRFTLLKGEDGKGLLAGNLDWVNMLQPPEPKTQQASLQIVDASGTVLIQRVVEVVSPTDAGTQPVKLFWTISGAPDIVQPQTRPVITPAKGDANTTGDMVTRALEELLWGPPAISQVGFGTALPTTEQVLTYPGREPDWGPRVTLQKLTINGGRATADFSKEMRAYGGGSLRVKLIHDQIAETLKQFPGIQDLVISIDGQTDGVLEP
ncbi:MAG: serine hydrolase [Chloroflexota bacterium]